MGSRRRPMREPVPADAAAWPQEQAGEALWIEVIRKMDETYADLVRYQVELEEKNSALEEAQQFIASVLASMTDVLIVCDAQGRIQRVNAALESLVGESEAALRGRPFLSLLAAESLPLAGTFGEQVRRLLAEDVAAATLDVFEIHGVGRRRMERVSWLSS